MDARNGNAKKRVPVKAMILAAGEGRRMRPLTNDTPKPLLTIGGVSLIEHHILRLREAGIYDFVINVAYLGQKIIQVLGYGEKYGVRITYSVESSPLETGGALNHALPLLIADSHDEVPFLLVNGDVWTDIDFAQLMHNDILSTHDACLVLVDNPAHNTAGDFQLQTVSSTDGKCLIMAYDAGVPSYTFSGVSVIHPRLITTYPKRRDVFPLKEVFDLAISEQRMIGIHHDGEWVDIGTPERLYALRHRFDSTSTPRAC